MIYELTFQRFGSEVWLLVCCCIDVLFLNSLLKGILSIPNADLICCGASLKKAQLRTNLLKRSCGVMLLSWLSDQAVASQILWVSSHEIPLCT